MHLNKTRLMCTLYVELCNRYIGSQTPNLNAGHVFKDAVVTFGWSTFTRSLRVYANFFFNASVVQAFILSIARQGAHFIMTLVVV